MSHTIQYEINYGMVPCWAGGILGAVAGWAGAMSISRSPRRESVDGAAAGGAAGTTAGGEAAAGWEAGTTSSVSAPGKNGNSQDECLTSNSISL